ncbi:MAG: hypothetical protein RPU72_12475 [Candidatus Sedimenticola sp. (ex Thyasira tokunagai)]
MMSFQMKNGEVNAFTVNGLNTLSKTQAVYGDGTGGAEVNIH